MVIRVTALAPCAVTTYQQTSNSEDDQGDSHNADGHHDHEHTHWRVLSDMIPSVEEPRQLSTIVEEDMPLRELDELDASRRELGYSYSNSYSSYSYWDRTEAYCNYNPASCYNYCDWYPNYCDAFCTRCPQFCVPDAIKNYYGFLEVAAMLDIYSFYGPNWS